MLTAAPSWYRNALSTPAAEGEVLVEGCRIRYRHWGAPGTPGLVLVHGGAAHARWWDHLGPVLAGTDRHHVIAVDLAGHGDSDRRERYTWETWSADVLAATEAAGVVGSPVLVGHSMGGFVVIAAAAAHGERLAGAILVDAPVRRPDPESTEARGGRMFRHPGTYPDVETALQHFHLVPPQPEPDAHVLDHVARHSLRPGPDGWTWKFDPAVFARREDPAVYDFGGMLGRVRCRIAVLHGELSNIVTADVTDYMSERLGRTAPFVEIPQAHHHLILDQPLAFVAAVRALLADWEHSNPHHIPGLA